MKLKNLYSSKTFYTPTNNKLDTIKWLSNNLKKLELTEYWNCSVFSDKSNEIHISGDNDLLILTIV